MKASEGMRIMDYFKCDEGEKMAGRHLPSRKSHISTYHCCEWERKQRKINFIVTTKDLSIFMSWAQKASFSSYRCSFVKNIIRLTITVIIADGGERRAKAGKKEMLHYENTYLTRNLKSNVTYLTLSIFFLCHSVHDILPNSFVVQKQFLPLEMQMCIFHSSRLLPFGTVYVLSQNTPGMKNKFMNINCEIWIHLPFRGECGCSLAGFWQLGFTYCCSFSINHFHGPLFITKHL